MMRARGITWYICCGIGAPASGTPGCNTRPLPPHSHPHHTTSKLIRNARTRLDDWGR
jgi:hypothetical protein